MPTLPWRSPTPHDGSPSEAVVLASRLELGAFHQIPRFLVAALRIRRQVLRSPGALGLSLIADPRRKTFWTLSAWTDDAALGEFVAAPPHRDVMASYRGQLVAAQFTTFRVKTDELPPTRPATALWSDGKRRLASQKVGAAS